LKLWIEDEWYSLDESPREHIHVLISLDESAIEMRTFNGKDMAVGDHTIACYHIFDGGRILPN